MLSYDIQICRVSTHNYWQVVLKQLASLFFNKKISFFAKKLCSLSPVLKNYVLFGKGEQTQHKPSFFTVAF